MSTAVFNPGPSFWDTETRKYAGWLRIPDLMKNALEQEFEHVFIPQVPEELIDRQTTVSKITTWDLVTADQLPLKEDVDFFLGPPGYSLAQIMRLKQHTNTDLLHEFETVYSPTIMTYVFNNADWWRDKQLADEYAAFKRPYDLSPAWRWINKRALELSDVVLACSPFVKATHARLVREEKIEIAFWGVDSKMFTPDWGAIEQMGLPLRVLFVGSDPIRKGLIYLLLASQDLEGIDLTIVGTDVQFSFTGSEHVKNLGLVPHDQMPGIMRQHQVIVCPSLEDGIACVVQEGMASGLVPIATPDPAEVFEHGKSGFKIDYRDVGALKGYLALLRDRPEGRMAVAREARALAESQTWEKFQMDFKAIVQKALFAKREGGAGEKWTS